MSDIGLRGRVERLLRGDFRPDDLTRLFLYARDRCDGRETVQEIGDFVAHHNERTKGIVTRTVRDFFTILRFHLPPRNQPLDGANLPTNFPKFLRAIFRRIEVGDLRRETGLGRADARKVLEQSIKKMTRNRSGALSLSPSHNSKEITLMQCLSQYLIAKVAFDDERLFVEFSDTLKSHGLLQKSELRDFVSIKPAFSLYAVTVMDNCVIKLMEGTTAMLSTGGNSPDGTICVMAAADVSALQSFPAEVSIASPIFTTRLDAR